MWRLNEEWIVEPGRSQRSRGGIEQTAFADERNAGPTAQHAATSGARGERAAATAGQPTPGYVVDVVDGYWSSTSPAPRGGATAKYRSRAAGVAWREGHRFSVPAPSAAAVRPGHEEEPAAGGSTGASGHHRCSISGELFTEEQPIVHVLAEIDVQQQRPQPHRSGLVEQQQQRRNSVLTFDLSCWPVFLGLFPYFKSIVRGGRIANVYSSWPCFMYIADVMSPPNITQIYELF